MKEVWEDMKISGKSVLERGNRRCKGHEAGVWLACLSHSKEGCVAGMEGAMRDEKEMH